MRLNRTLITLTASALFCFTAQAAYQEKPNPWSQVTQTYPGDAQVIGGYANGCQQGAQTLPETGTGYYDIRRFRHRYFAQPDTIDLIRRIGQHVAQTTGEKILIGDLSQPIGGLMSYAHVSHQNGLDVDIYFASVPGSVIPDKDHEPPLVVDKAAGVMRMDRWKPAYRNALYAAATDPRSTRIFVNPIIKQYLCNTESNTAWLRKLRPWGGHDEHFHVRLACPEGQYLCVNQKPIPPGDGCDPGLAKWIADQSNAILHPKPKPYTPPKPRPEPPQSCQILLTRSQSL